MSTTYPNYPGTSYPDSIDTFAKIVDVTISTLPYAILYQNYFERGELESASQVLTEHPELEQCLMNADKFNKLIDAIKAIESDHNSTKSNVNTITNQTNTNTSNISKLTTNVNNITNNMSSLSTTVNTINNKVINIENTGTTATKESIGLGNVDNTADINKHVAHAVSANSATNSDTVDGYHVTISTTDLSAGTSPLTTNTFCFVYE
jgi:prophage DNA circulation protein